MDLGNLKVQAGGRVMPRYVVLTIYDNNTNSIDLTDGGPFHVCLGTGRRVPDPISRRAVKE